MQELFVWVPMTDGVIAGGTTTLIPSHTFQFEGFADVPVPDVRFDEYGVDGRNTVALQMSVEASDAFAAEVTELMRDGTIHSPNDLRRYPNLGFLRFLNHNPYADSVRLHIILIPQ
jgi:hypothetical protein